MYKYQSDVVLLKKDGQYWVIADRLGLFKRNEAISRLLAETIYALSSSKVEIRNEAMEVLNKNY